MLFSSDDLITLLVMKSAQEHYSVPKNNLRLLALRQTAIENFLSPYYRKLRPARKSTL